MSTKAAKLERAAIKAVVSQATSDVARQQEAARLAQEAFLASLPPARYEVLILGNEAPLYLPMSEAQQADPGHFVKMAFAGGITCKEPHVPDGAEAILHIPPWRIHAIRVVGAASYTRPSIIV